MVHLTGQPLYCYTLAIELSKNHDVTIVSDFENINKDENIYKLMQNLINSKINCMQFNGDISGDYDIAFLSERCSIDVMSKINCKKYINIIHSEFECEAPILSEKIYKYVAIRESIRDHLQNNYNIGSNRINVIYNGIDRGRFSREKRIKPRNNLKKIVIPCTVDGLRERFLNYAIDTASEFQEINIYGEYFDGKIGRYKKYLPKFVYRSIPIGMMLGRNVNYYNHVFDIENHICDADEVWGIKMGRVNLEANSMGIPSVIFDPFSLTQQRFLMDDKEFDDKFNIKNVANRLMSL